MKSQRTQLSAISLLVLCSSLGSPNSHAAADMDKVKIKLSSRSTESFERQVDQAALDSQAKAIAKIQALLKKYRGKRQEPMLLVQLAESQQQAASIEFRVAHGLASRGKGSLNLNKYHGMMRELIANLTTIMTRFPEVDEISHIYFMRGSAYEELNKPDAATKDYLALVAKFPDAPDAVKAYMNLAEISIRGNNHERAIGYLKNVEAKPESPYFPFALYKMAWSYFNLKNIPQSLSYISRNISYYRGKSADADMSFRDNALLDAVTFYFEGYEQKISEYGRDKALKYFRSLDDTTVLGRMMAKFAKQLRSHGHDADLIAWKDEVIDKESDRPEAFDVLVITYEHQQNRRRYDQLVQTANDMVRLSKNKLSRESLARGQKLILDTAEDLQSIIVKNKNASDLAPYSKALAGIFDAFINMVEENDPRVAKAHYNLAETLFTIKDFEGAASHYRWVVNHPQSKGIDLADASLKAISSRYEALSAKKLLPTSLAARSMKDDRSAKAEDTVLEWLTWVDEHVSRHGKLAENFYFEANRTLYTVGAIKRATERFESFALKNPASKFAIPSATLVVDTYVMSEDWERLHKLAVTLLRIESWSKTEFAKKVYSLNVDALYKMAEASYAEKNFEIALGKAEEFFKDFRKARERKATEASIPSVLATYELFLSLAGRISQQLQYDKRAIAYYSELINLAPKSENAAKALLARGTLYERFYSFSAASRDYLSYLALPESLTKAGKSDRSGLQRRALVLSFLAAEPLNKTQCTEELSLDCERYETYQRLVKGDVSQKEAEAALERSRKGNKENRALFATLALSAADKLNIRDRYVAVRELANSWDNLDPMFQIALTASLSSSVSGAFGLNRKAMGSVAPLQGSDRYITQRINAIKEFESAATAAAKLPFIRIKAEILNEVAWVYMELTKGLRDLPVPKEIKGAEAEAYQKMVSNLVMPFEEKAADVRGKAFEIAEKHSIEDDSFKRIADPFFQENPSQAKAYKKKVSDEDADLQSLDPSILRRLDIEGKWTYLKADCSEQSECFKYFWVKAVKEKNWAQIAFFLQNAHEKALLSPRVLGLIRAISLNAMGARAEGLVEFEQARKVITAEGK